MKLTGILSLLVLASIPSLSFAQAEAPHDGATAPKVAPAPAPAAKPAAPAAKPSRDSLTTIRQRGMLIACVPPQAPWGYNAADGSLQGFSVDVARQLAEDLGVSVEFVVNDYPSLIAAVAEGECDVVAGSLSATPERALFAHFSQPLARHEIAVVAAKEAAAGWSRLADLDRPDVAVGVLAGTAEAIDARRVFPKAKLVEFAELQALAEGLTSGRIGAAVVAEPLPSVALKLAGDKVTKPLSEPVATRTEAFAVRRGDLEFLAYLDTWVAARRNDGWLDERRRVWFVELGWLQ